MYMSGNLQDAYRSILSSDPTAYRTIFQHLLSPTPAPILIHCTAGKDRTGVICALILLIAGVEEELIAREYALTTTGLETMREVILQYLMKDKNSMRGSGRERAENMLSSNAETMLQFIKIVNEEYGGVKEYLSKVLGFTQEEIEEIRMHVVSEEEPLEGLLRKL
ncbi:protein-tyrosine phosphatase-like protein [Kalaharituber pfeilii]|nr:protein-tyrosine phosphatase-like protein [Kalaharituber pfeilii]